MIEAQRVAQMTEHEQTRLRLAAHSWRYDTRMEQLAALRDNDRATYDRLGPTARISLGHYDIAKSAAARYGLDVSAEGNKGDNA